MKSDSELMRKYADIINEVTGDSKFDAMMANIVKGTENPTHQEKREALRLSNTDRTLEELPGENLQPTEYKGIPVSSRQVYPSEEIYYTYNLGIDSFLIYGKVGNKPFKLEDEPDSSISFCDGLTDLEKKAIKDHLIKNKMANTKTIWRLNPWWKNGNV